MPSAVVAHQRSMLSVVPSRPQHACAGRSLTHCFVVVHAGNLAPSTHWTDLTTASGALGLVPSLQGAFETVSGGTC